MSDRLPRIETSTIDVGTGVKPRGQNGAVTINDAVATLFLNVTDDMTTPFMSAWRRMPKVEYERKTSLRRDQYSITSRYGFGMQRPQSLVTVPTSAVNY